MVVLWCQLQITVNYDSLYTVIGCDINTVLMLASGFVTLCKHEMAVSAKMLVV